MSEISFYHLLYSTAPTAIVRLLHKALERDMRAILLCSNNDEVKQMDELLWTFSPNVFLPHATSNDDLPEQQPILITSSVDHADNKADLLIAQGCSQGLEADYISSFTKIMDVFNGTNDNDVMNARNRWSAYKKQGYEMTYWKQSQNGGWSKG